MNSILVTKAVIWVYQVIVEMKVLHHILVMGSGKYQIHFIHMCLDT